MVVQDDFGFAKPPAQHVQQSGDSRFDFEAAKHLPENICFGTSTWTYPGWRGLVYHREYKSEKQFKASCLEEYARFPWFRTVGIDNTFYTPPRPGLLESYAAQVPAEFRWVSKVWERITIPRFPKHARYGAVAGKKNDDFLRPETFVQQVLSRYRPADVERHSGPFVFQFPTINKLELSSVDFFERLRNFLLALPADFSYAVEVRNPEYLSNDYFSVLNEARATHCFNQWHFMPSLHEQMAKAADGGGLKSDFLLARLLTPPGVSYENAVKMFQPYEVIKQPLPEVRQDVLTFIRRGIKRKVKVYVIVNNRLEGNSPLTIDAIGRMVAKDASATTATLPE